MTFADQVIVMYDGAIVQIGTPQELFEQPAHKFVGFFIGSPGMNFLPCTVDGKLAHVDGLTVDGKLAHVDGLGITLDDDTAALAQHARGKMEIGIRPMYLKVHSEPLQGCLPAKVKLVQDQGSFKILTLNMAGYTLNAHVSEDQAVPSEEAWLEFPQERTRLFADERLVVK